MPPMPPPPLYMDLVHAPTPPQGRTHSPVRSLVGHSNLPSVPCPGHDLPSIGLHFAPPQLSPTPTFGLNSAEETAAGKLRKLE